MDFLNKIIQCSDEKLEEIIKKRIEEKNGNATKVELIGILNNNQSNFLFKGFIPLDTRIKYSNLSIEDYKMNTTDFYYEFARFIKKNNINTKAKLVYSLELFILDYFGFPGKNNREEIFFNKAYKNTTTDEELFNALEKNQIGDLKKMGAAQCSEISALAQQLLSFFDIESYFVTGCINFNGKDESHCFNIVKRQDDYVILDYSISVASYDFNNNINNYYPFIGILSNEDFIKFTSNNMEKTFENYYYADKKKKTNGEVRIYAAGKYEIKKTKVNK